MTENVDWERLQEVYGQAAGLDGKIREQYLARACESDPTLAGEVEALLELSDRAELFLEQPAGAEALPWNGTSPDGDAPISPGVLVGHYELTELLGEGGMGMVYRARRADGEYDKQVAIKLVRPGWQVGQSEQRFRGERQILASLTHPNIARLLEGGTTAAGAPYFVMELVDGEPIDVYSGKQQLSLRARIALFLSVCAAVDYAHQRLIIHRDLKPSNILVTAEGEVKLLDFGIAKLVSEEVPGESASPITFHFTLTPAYASPEQIRGESATTACDVYALGVVLFELLTGVHPYRKSGATWQEIARAACDIEPIRPSRVAAEDGDNTQRISRRRIDGDLDKIVLKALHKEPDRRYSSVQRFADDLDRYLRGLPVKAAGDLLRYRTWKFLQRRKLSVTAITAACLLIALALFTAIREAQIANAERLLAERHFAEVRKLANSIVFELYGAIKDLPDSTQARLLLAQRALRYLDSLARESNGDLALQQELASAYESLADIQGQARHSSEGDLESAKNSYERALAVRQRIVAAQATNVDVQRGLVPLHGKLSDLLWTSGDLRGAMAESRSALHWAQEVSAQDPASRGQRMLAMARMDYAYKIGTIEGDYASSRKGLLEAAAWLESSARSDPRLRRPLALCYDRLGEATSQDAGSYAAALQYFRKSRDILDTLLAKDPGNVDLRHLEAFSRHHAAPVRLAMNDRVEARELESRAVAEFRSLAAQNPGVREFEVDIAMALQHMGEIELAGGQARAAIRTLKDSLGRLDRLGATRGHALWRSVAADCQRVLGDSYFRLFRNPRKTAAASSGPREEQRFPFPASGRASASFARGNQKNAANLDQARVWWRRAEASYDELGDNPEFRNRALLLRRELAAFP